MKSIYLFYILICLGCNAINKPDPVAVSSPKGYRLDQPEKMKLREMLDEISGMVYYAPMNAIIAINDEEGELYAVPLDSSRHYNSWKFTRHGDFEDLAFTGTDWFALKSNGTIFKINNCFTDSISSEGFPFPGAVRNDFESLYYDGTRLIIICKTCKNDEKKVTSAYAFDIITLKHSEQPIFQLEANLNSLGNEEKYKSLRPSAAAIHPVSKELYVIASLNDVLLIADASGKIKELFHLDSDLFKQPEGITFSPSGDMYISNEAKGGIANILKFAYKPGN
jgi:SdiA-regulated